MNWNEAKELMTTARDKTKGKPIGNNTRLYFTTAEEIKGTRGWNNNLTYFPYFTIRLHGNRIIDIYEDRILPSDGGWQTVTTKARLNEHLPQGFFVFQNNWEWFLQDMNTNADEPLVYPFDDVFYISTKDNKVMLYSTHPNYPDVYSENELVGDVE